MARKISGKEAGKIEKAKNATMYEPGSVQKKRAGQYSTKTIEVAKKQGALKNSTVTNMATNLKDEKTLLRIQLQRNNDIAKTKGRAQLIESNANRRKKVTPSNRKTFAK